jgi:hypothetical protein
MDDPEDRGESRAPQLQDVLDLCAALNREGARYLLIGGFAVILHGGNRAAQPDWPAPSLARAAASCTAVCLR